MSISNSYPTQRPSLNLDFANSGKLDSRLSYSRSSGGTYLSNEKALSSENLLLQSQDFDTSPWQKLNLAASGLTGGATAPDGTSTAWLLTSGVSTGSTQTPSVYMNLFGTSAGMVQPNSQNTYVMHVKSGTATHAWVTVRGDGSNYVAAVLDFSNTSSLTTYQVGWTLDSYQLTALGNSWYRIALTFTSNSVVNAGQVYVGPTDSNTLTTYYPQWAFNGETIFVWGAQLSATNSKVYDSPTTTQISREYAPLLKTAAADEPRFEFASDGQSEGLLIQSQSTNLATYGSDLTNAVWNPLSATASTAAIGPDGTLSAAKLTSGTGSGLYPRFRRLSFLSTSKTQTFSVYVKPLEYSYLNISQDGHSTQMVHYNLTGSGSISSSAGCSGTVEQCGNGWFRVSFTHTNATSSANLAIVMQSTATYSSETGNSYDGMLFASAQLEDAATASSFIGTTSSTVTRSADSCSVATADFGYTGGPVTMVGEVTGSGSGYSAMAELRDTVAKAAGRNTYMMIWKPNFTGTDSTNFQLYVYENSSPYSNLVAGGSGGATTVAARMDTNNVGVCADGGAVTTDTSAVILDSLDTLYIGRGISGFELGSTIKRLAIYNAALSDTEMQALTSS